MGPVRSWFVSSRVFSVLARLCSAEALLAPAADYFEEVWAAATGYVQARWLVSSGMSARCTLLALCACV
ncbi:hypothetical protein EON68_01905 [archaeon]|nr:MAG: hypothetical protein EON68_01905 [archaeon]